MSNRLCWFLAVLLLASCGSPTPPPAGQPETAKSQQAETQVAELQSKITKWQSNRDKVTKLLEQMQTDKTGILQKLVELGVKSENDLVNNPKGQVLHGELKDIVNQITLYDKKFQDYDLAILKSESRVRSIARQLSAKEAGVSDTELEELTRSMVTLDESLSSEKEPAVPIDLKDTLKDELAHYHEKPKTPPMADAPVSQGHTLAKSDGLEANTQPQKPPAISAVSLAPTPQPPILAARTEASRPPRLQIPSGAILVLTFEEQSLRRAKGTLAEVMDLGGKSLVGTVHNVAVVPGKVGNGLEFGDGKHSVTFEGDFPIEAHPRTMAVWLKQTGTGTKGFQSAIHYGPYIANSCFAINCGDQWKFGYGGGGGSSLLTGISPDNAWHHHCVTYDGQEVRYYFDGRVAVKQNRILHTKSGPLTIGQSFRGVIDEVALFDRALSPEEVQHLYQMGKDGISLAGPK